MTPIRASVLLIAFALTVALTPVMAAQWDVHSLMSELSSRSSGTARFSEKKYIEVLDAPIEQSGTLAYSPGNLVKTTLSPRIERMTIRGDTMTIESGTKKPRRVRLSRYPALWGFVEGMRSALTGDLRTLQAFYDIELHGSPEDWELVLVPSHRNMRAVVRLVSIRGEEDHIRIIEVVETSGDRSVTHVDEDPA